MRNGFCTYAHKFTGMHSFKVLSRLQFVFFLQIGLFKGSEMYKWVNNIYLMHNGNSRFIFNILRLNCSVCLVEVKFLLFHCRFPTFIILL